MILRIMALCTLLLILAACESTPAEPTVPPTPPPAVSAVDLYAEREANATRFDMDRKGNWITVSGMVAGVEDGKIKLVTDLAGFNVMGDVFLEYIALEGLTETAQASVNKGQQFTATCEVGNYILGTMYLKDCRE